MRDDGVMDRVVASEVMRSGWIQDTYEEELMVSDDELDLQYKELPNINSFMSKWVNELLVVLFMEDSLYPNVLFQYLLNLNMFFLSFHVPWLCYMSLGNYRGKKCDLMKVLLDEKKRKTII